MKLEELIQKRFTEREGLTKFLAKFGDYPAIFSPEAPKDNQDWGTDVHYPRLVYNYDMQADEECFEITTTEERRNIVCIVAMPEHRGCDRGRYNTGNA
jgi:hypothetical protein